MPLRQADRRRHYSEWMCLQQLVSRGRAGFLSHLLPVVLGLKHAKAPRAAQRGASRLIDAEAAEARASPRAGQKVLENVHGLERPAELRECRKKHVAVPAALGELAGEVDEILHPRRARRHVEHDHAGRKSQRGLVLPLPHELAVLTDGALIALAPVSRRGRGCGLGGAIGLDDKEPIELSALAVVLEPEERVGDQVARDAVRRQGEAERGLRAAEDLVCEDVADVLRAKRRELERCRDRRRGAVPSGDRASPGGAGRGAPVLRRTGGDLRDERDGDGPPARGRAALPRRARGGRRHERQVLREPRVGMGLPRERADGRPRPLLQQQGVRGAGDRSLPLVVLRRGCGHAPCGAGLGPRRQRDRGRRLDARPPHSRHHARHRREATGGDPQPRRHPALAARAGAAGRLSRDRRAALLRRNQVRRGMELRARLPGLPPG